MRPTFCAVAVAMLMLALGACGDSSEDKAATAQTTVCDGRANIGKEVDKLSSLTPATVTTDAVTQSLGAIKNDLKDMAGAQSDLSGDRRDELQAANKAFTSSIRAITGDVLTSLSASDAKAALVTALQALKTSYKTAFAPLDCN
jgi:hypothetical protein